MTMTDPIADMLTRLRNANQAYHDAVRMPYSKLKEGVAEILKQEGYITVLRRAPSPPRAPVGKTLTITLKYGRNRERSIAGVRRISKPGLRVYAKPPACPRCSAASASPIISTSQGLMTDRQAQPEGRGRRSPRLRLVTRDREGDRACRASASSPSRSRPASTSTIDERARDRQGPQGHPVARPSPRRSRSRAGRRRPRGQAPERRAREPRRCTA